MHGLLDPRVAESTEASRAMLILKKFLRDVPAVLGFVIIARWSCSWRSSRRCWRPYPSTTATSPWSA